MDSSDVSWFEEALRCKTKREAKAWMNLEIATYSRQHKVDEEKAERVIKKHLGYMAGYYDHKTAQKIFRLFGAVHPIFKNADYHKTLKPEEAFKIGLSMGRDLNRRAIEQN